jgi:hypothetical protein
VSGSAFIRRYEPGDDVGFVPRADMIADYTAEGGVLPAGRKWVLIDDGHMLAFGGVDPDRAGWLLPGEGLTRRHWAMIAEGIRNAMDGASIVALVSPVPGAARFLTRLGFAETDIQGVYHGGN